MYEQQRNCILADNNINTYACMYIYENYLKQVSPDICSGSQDGVAVIRYVHMGVTRLQK